MLVPKKALQVVVPRPGVPAEVQIGLVGGGDVEGALVKSGGIGFEGVDLELVDASGKVIAKTPDRYDGFFLFERVAYGSYTIRVAQDSADAAKIDDELGTHFVITPGQVDDPARHHPALLRQRASPMPARLRQVLTRPEHAWSNDQTV